MVLLFYAVTALVSLLGGMIILFRSGVPHGRAIAVGLLSIASLEISYLVFSLWDTLSALQVASFFELSAISSFTVSVISMEKRLSRKAGLVTWTRRALILTCILYAIALVTFPDAYAEMHLSGVVVIWWLGKLQSIVLLLGSILFIWIMENILRSSQGTSRRMFTYPALGSISVGASLCMSSLPPQYKLHYTRYSYPVLLNIPCWCFLPNLLLDPV